MGIATEVINKQNKPEMLRRALERIIQLYTDKSHFVYELLQNAEDSGATSIRFEQFVDRLEVYHNGKPFTVQNLSALCDIGKSDKVDNLNQIGEFGVGFKSVFGICETVKLYSNPSHYKNDCEEYVPFAVQIQDFTNPIDIEQIELPHDFTTKFVFPYAVNFSFSGFKSKEELNRVLSKRLKNLGITTLLFMKNLELIEYRIVWEGKEEAGEYLLDKSTVNDHCTLVSALGSSNEQEESISYLTFSRPIETSQATNRTIDIAFPVKLDENGGYDFQKTKYPFISVYFPTETESKLNFIVQGPYRTTPNRSSVPADDAENLSLAKQTLKLYRDSLVELRDAGKFNMSLLRILPIQEDVFESYALFEGFYEETKTILTTKKILPTKNGGYTYADFAKIVRNQKIAELIDDALLTELCDEGQEYKWLPTTLTDTGKDRVLYEYITSELDVGVIRPESLREYINKNPKFLPRRNNDWLSQLYSIFESIPNEFNKRNGTMLNAEFVKTKSGKFVAPYRRNDSFQYVPNVFLPILKTGVRIDANFVDTELYEKHTAFFEEVLHLQKPNEFDYFIKDIKRRYQNISEVSYEQHAEDMKLLLKYKDHTDYQSEVNRFIRQDLYLRFKKDGKKGYINPAFNEMYFSSLNGINIEGYFCDIAQVYYVDLEFYRDNGIDENSLIALGVKSRIIQDDIRTEGEYNTGNPGRQPHWNTYGAFRWKLTITKLGDAIRYIAQHPTAPNSMIKSQTIFKVLQMNETALQGTVYIGGTHPNLDNAVSEAVALLQRPYFFVGYQRTDWNRKWLYASDGRIVSPTEITPEELHQDIYGEVRTDSKLYEILKFKEDTFKKYQEDYANRTDAQRQFDFEQELKRRFGITIDELEEKVARPITVVENEPIFEFPIVPVQNWDSLKQHAKSIRQSAPKVTYEERVRSVRISNPGTQQTYCKNMYRVLGTTKCACQMCHKPKEYIEAHEITLKPELELDAPYLCLCPECASKYDSFRFDESKIKKFIDTICKLETNDIAGDTPIEIPIGNERIWFAHTHVAEIRELYLLQMEDSTEKKSEPTSEQMIPLEELTVGHKNFGKPSQEKVDALIAYYRNNGKLDKPIVVSRHGEKYLIEDKYLRYYVAKLLGLKVVPVRIITPTNTKTTSPNKSNQVNTIKEGRVLRAGENLMGKTVIISFGKGQEIRGIVKEDKSGMLSLKIEDAYGNSSVEKYQIAPNVRAKFIRVID